MIKLARRELKELGVFLRVNISPITIIGAALLLFSLKEYHPLSPYWLSSLFYFLVLPLLVIVLLLRRNLFDFGLGIGNWRNWLFHVVIFAVISVPVLYLASRFTQLDDYYTIENMSLLRYSLEIIVYMAGWEFFCRGFLLFGLKEKLGELSIFIQLIPFVLAHLGKPEMETLSTILTGIYFGYVAYRGNSFWPAFIIHVFINIVFRIMVNYL